MSLLSFFSLFISHPFQNFVECTMTFLQVLETQLWAKFDLLQTIMFFLSYETLFSSSFE